MNFFKKKGGKVRLAKTIASEDVSVTYEVVLDTEDIPYSQVMGSGVYLMALLKAQDEAAGQGQQGPDPNNSANKTYS